MNALKTRLNIIKSDLKKVEAQIESGDFLGSYDDWKEILKLARHLEACAISRMAVIKYCQALEKKEK